MYVIFGASGNAGRSAVAALRHAGHAVRAVVRNPEHIRALTDMGCEVAIADLADRASVERALAGAHTVQVLCPVPYRAPDPAAAMRLTIATVADALRGRSHLHVLALSDYGAELESGTGITMLYRDLEAMFAEVAPRLTLLRSAEHMENWARVLPVALKTGYLSTFHGDVELPFPSVSAHDIGTIAAQLMLEGPHGNGVRVVSAEGPRRYHVNDVARFLGEISGRRMVAHAVPREAWYASFMQAELSHGMASLLIETNDAQNNGRIDAERGSVRCFGTTELRDALLAIVPSAESRHTHA